MKYKLSLLALTFVGAFAAETNTGCSNRFIVKMGYSKLNNDNLHKNKLVTFFNTIYEDSSITVKKFSGHRVCGYII